MKRRIALRAGLATALFAVALPALAGAQKEEQLSQSVVNGLSKSIADAPVRFRDRIFPLIDSIFFRLSTSL